MKAIEYKHYGTPEVFQLTAVSKPIPKPNEVLIRVYATTATAADSMMRVGKPLIGRLYLGLMKPKRTILGFEFAGEIEAIGIAVRRFKIGDRVFGGTTTLGCYAEYTCVAENDVITTIPDNCSYEEAAPVSGSAITVLNFLTRKTTINQHQKVLIIGASGALGTYAVQFAKYMGAEVTGVCSTNNIELVKSIGADHVIDYTQEDFTKNREQYAVIFDTVNKHTYKYYKKSLAPTGIYLPSVLQFKDLGNVLFTSLFGAKKIKSSSTGLLPAKKRFAYFLEIKALMESRQLKTILDTPYRLEEMAEAHAYIEKGHKKGNVVITV